MSLYSQISKNKKKTFLIIFVFVLILSAFFYLIGYLVDSPTLFFTIGLLISIFSSLFSYYNSDKIVLYLVSARPASKEEYFDFYTVAENLSIAAGLPMPKLYVIDDPSPNAFATGRNPKHAVICATTGLLSLLDREELEGVIGHELSHIKNYDVLLASVVATLVSTVAFVSDIILRYLWWGGDDNEDRDRSPILYVLAFIALLIMPLVATLIQLAISRQREFLADASSAYLTRNPRGLIKALKKLESYSKGMSHVSPSVAHLFIVNPLKKKKSVISWLNGLFNTHPPIEERIKLLERL